MLWGIGYLPNTSAIVARETARDLLCGRCNVPEACAVSLLSFGAKAGDGKNLSVFLDALLQLAKQDAKSCSTVSEIFIWIGRNKQRRQPIPAA